MDDPVFDRTAFADPLVTEEDYEKACKEFAEPFLFVRAERVKNLISTLGTELQKKVTPETPFDEETKDYIAQIKKHSTFPEDITTFLEEISALERKLDAEGVFDEKSV